MSKQTIIQELVRDRVHYLGFLRVLCRDVELAEELFQELCVVVIEKIENPAWRVPKSIKAHNAARGRYTPDIVPPGPNNPLGDFAIRLGAHSYLIHGTNNPTSIGKPISSGCIRLME